MVLPSGFVSFEATEDAMEDDSLGAGISTPEHWSDVGPLSSRLQLVEQQVQVVQANLSNLSSQMTVMGHSMQQIETQLMMQQKQHEDLMKVLVTHLAVPSQDGAANAAVPNPSGQRNRARPGPRERQRLRQQREDAEVHQAISQPEKPEVEETPPPPPVPPPASPPTSPPASPPASQPASPPASPVHAKTQRPWASHPRRMSWFVVILMWPLAMRDLNSPSPSWDAVEYMEDFDVASAEPLGDTSRMQNAERLRELGHLQLAVSDCQGAAQLFGKALELANGTVTATGSALDALSWDLGLALVCAQRFEEAVDVLGQFAATDLPVHLLNALGFAQFHRGEVPEAGALWQQAVELAPMNPVLWNNLGVAKLLLGDSGASDALLLALRHAEQLATAAGRYYLQLVSNNIHTQRLHLPSELRPEQLHVEIFHCVAPDISVKVSATSVVELVQQYKAVEEDAAAEGVDLSVIEMTRKAVLSSESEYLLCP